MPSPTDQEAQRVHRADFLDCRRLSLSQFVEKTIARSKEAFSVRWGLPADLHNSAAAACAPGNVWSLCGSPAPCGEVWPSLGATETEFSLWEKKSLEKKSTKEGVKIEVFLVCKKPNELFEVLCCVFVYIVCILFKLPSRRSLNYYLVSGDFGICGVFGILVFLLSSGPRVPSGDIPFSYDLDDDFKDLQFYCLTDGAIVEPGPTLRTCQL